MERERGREGGRETDRQKQELDTDRTNVFCLLYDTDEQQPRISWPGVGILLRDIQLPISERHNIQLSKQIRRTAPLLLGLEATDETTAV